MKLRRILPILVVLISTSSFAGSISFTNLNATFTMIPNYGSGDNMVGSIVGPGVNLGFGGGTNWFFSSSGFAPGSVWGSLGGVEKFPGAIMPDNVSGTIGSQFYPLNNISIGSPNIDMGSFTFPTNGGNFTITVPASIGLFYGATCCAPSFPFTPFT